MSRVDLKMLRKEIDGINDEIDSHKVEIEVLEVRLKWLRKQCPHDLFTGRVCRDCGLVTNG